MMLAGLRSRCSTPRSCAAANPAQSCRAISSALSSGSRPMRRSSDARSSPSTYSIVRNGSPSASPMSYTRHTFGCDTCRAMRTSLWNCASAHGSPRRRGQELQRDRLPEPQVVGAIDLAHAAFSKAPTMRYRSARMVPGGKRPWETSGVVSHDGLPGVAGPDGRESGARAGATRAAQAPAPAPSARLSARRWRRPVGCRAPRA